LRRSLPDLREDALDHVGPEGRGRLVEDEDLRFERQCFGELDQLPLRDAEVLHPGIAVDVATDSREPRSDPIRSRPVFQSICPRDSEQHVLADRQIRQERRLLVHDREPELPRDLRGQTVGLRAADLDPPGIRSE
jgi:hypothetical protein